MFYTIVQCEKCLRISRIAYACGVTHARSIARKYGWSVGKKKGDPCDYTICPDCRRGAKKNAE